MWNIWNTRWIRCKGSCLQLLGFWNFFVFFQFFPLKLVYFWTKSRKKNIWVFFPHILCHWFQFWHQKQWKIEIINLKNSDFCNFWLYCSLYWDIRKQKESKSYSIVTFSVVTSLRKPSRTHRKRDRNVTTYNHINFDQ